MHCEGEEAPGLCTGLQVSSCLFPADTNVQQGSAPMKPQLPIRPLPLLRGLKLFQRCDSRNSMCEQTAFKKCVAGRELDLSPASLQDEKRHPKQHVIDKAMNPVALLGPSNSVVLNAEMEAQS
ncbi:Hypothetical predicted protein [Podarcis lilfordi]|uniref:Uncharacterized protein n=1 Tax=Podarcis lilfordi TaxID=74358 RepID=A0AA35P840_9SAUR|nr:Hypothetical predicted protein [Podarcis lilfordi]